MDTRKNKWIQREGMDTTRKDGYKEKLWNQREGMDTTRSNGYNEKE